QLRDRRGAGGGGPLSRRAHRELPARRGARPAAGTGAELCRNAVRAARGPAGVPGAGRAASVAGRQPLVAGLVGASGHRAAPAPGPAAGRSGRHGEADGGARSCRGHSGARGAGAALRHDGRARGDRHAAGRRRCAGGRGGPERATRAAARGATRRHPGQPARDPGGAARADARGPHGRGGDRPAGHAGRALEGGQSLALRPGRVHPRRDSHRPARRLGRDQSRDRRPDRNRWYRSRFVCQGQRPRTHSLPWRRVPSRGGTGTDRLDAIAGRGAMAVATDGCKSQPRRSGERDVETVLSRSPVNLANLITVGRLLMVVPLVWLIVAENLLAAFWLFVVAGISDALDGFVAKRFNARTNLGSYLDPLADKVLLDGIYLALAMGQWLPAWLVALVIARDLLIVFGAAMIRRRNAVFRPEPLLI